MQESKLVNDWDFSLNRMTFKENYELRIISYEFILKDHFSNIVGASIF
ncbi:hypothetical protein BXY64_1217 [Marinifilum flexuosum]|uniref:Uncharacterized protein n=1 Tax=Marinifilum flexuosum TaxID=1117708 RepID=A0A419X8Y7_9BACT|nr:hypothetical protein BXY64_1217 [Marinifilum flexuosum]